MPRARPRSRRCSSSACIHGNFAFEVGNPGLKSERALGVDLSLRWRTPRASGEVTYFRNSISNYIFRRNMDEEEFEARARRVH